MEATDHQQSGQHDQ
uniref:Uncharacterized protein n=1 Tax=Arundo donax TaxID=35708 RepID=A0A0A9FU28_ARUDO